MSKFLNTTNRTVAWINKANESGDLEMKPPFQRNPVWTHPQKSYLIDSILNGFPVPEIYMQEIIDDKGNEKHIIIDGQQRIRACLDFIEGKFSIKEDESPTWGRMYFDDLAPEEKRRIFAYTFIVRLLPEMSDESIRGIFQRLNKNVVALNRQELRQATYWGPFIQTMQEISNFNYWNTTGIFTPMNVRRMMDIEYISELAIAVLHGHQNKKETLDKYYQEYEEEFEHEDDLVSTFKKVIYELEQILPDIKTTRWKKKTDFYSLFCYLASIQSAFPLTEKKKILLRQALLEFELQINRYLSSETNDESFSKQVIEYGKSIRASSDLGNRRRRHQALSEILSPIIASGDVSNIKSQVINPIIDNLFDEENYDDEIDL